MKAIFFDGRKPNLLFLATKVTGRYMKETIHVFNVNSMEVHMSILKFRPVILKIISLRKCLFAPKFGAG